MEKQQQGEYMATLTYLVKGMDKLNDKLDKLEMRIEERYVSKDALQAAFNEYRIDSMRMSRTKDDAIENRLNFFETSLKPLMEDLQNRVSDRKQMFWLVVGAFASSLIGLAVSLLNKFL